MHACHRLLDYETGSVHLRERVGATWRCNHELKTRLMSQDMEAQTPICSLPHSGVRLTPQKPILSVNTHTCTLLKPMKLSRKANDLRHTFGRESKCSGKCEDREGEQREAAEGKDTGMSSII